MSVPALNVQPGRGFLNKTVDPIRVAPPTLIAAVECWAKTEEPGGVLHLHDSIQTLREVRGILQKAGLTSFFQVSVFDLRHEGGSPEQTSILHVGTSPPSL